jgi:hypothetical protein
VQALLAEWQPEEQPEVRELVGRFAALLAAEPPQAVSV